MAPSRTRFSELETRFGAELNAVGVGSDANPDQLNQIDSSGTAQIVTTSDELTAALIEDGPTLPGALETATLTIKVTGEDDRDGVVDGEEFGEVMGIGYDDSNLPTNGGGDIIDGPDGLNDSILGNGGDDLNRCR